MKVNKWTYLFMACLVVAAQFYLYPRTREKRTIDSRVDLVVFSYNRPLQLYACLESIEAHVKNSGDIIVIARASEDKFAMGYEEVAKRFYGVKFWYQGNNPKEDFKPLVMKAVKQSNSAYVAFVVDDLIVKDTVDLMSCTDALKKTDAWGFYLRLGKNITYSYMASASQVFPKFKQPLPGINSWIFGESQGEWSYANSLDMTIFSKSKIEKDLKALIYHSPNTFESAWSQKSKRNKIGLCFDVSKIVNIPLNLVNSSTNRNMNSSDVNEMMELFFQGVKIDISRFVKMENRSPHEEVMPEFIKR